MSISVLILTRNEERNIEDCIKSCAFADEIIVVDDNSSDLTVAKAESLGAKVVNHALNNNYGEQRNFAISQATKEWIFFIDADERCTTSLVKAIEEAVKNSEKYGYVVERRAKFKHNKASHGTMRPDHVCRLMPKDGAHVVGAVHESFETPYPKKQLAGYMEHYTYDNWNQYFNKINRYAEISAEKYRERGKKSSFIKDVVVRPQWAFFKTYILDKGFLDGKIGFILASSHYFYTFQKYARLYYLYKSDGKF